jgi:hypothetical protein
MEEKSMKHQSANYVLRDGMEDDPSAEMSLIDIYIGLDRSSPIFSFNGLEEYAEQQRRREQSDSNKRLAWLEDSNGKIVAEATVRATTILDNDFQKAIEDEELAILQGELECNDEEIEEIGGMKP